VDVEAAQRRCERLFAGPSRRRTILGRSLGLSGTIPAVSIAIAGAVAVLAFSSLSLIDDAYISVRYAYNLNAGLGLVYNPGEPVEGYSNLLWTLLLTVPLRLGLAVDTFAIVAGMVFGILAIWDAWRICRHIGIGVWWSYAAIVPLVLNADTYNNVQPTVIVVHDVSLITGLASVSHGGYAGRYATFLFPTLPGCYNRPMWLSLSRRAAPRILPSLEPFHPQSVVTLPTGWIRGALSGFHYTPQSGSAADNVGGTANAVNSRGSKKAVTPLIPSPSRVSSQIPCGW
jgi:hypothetical protein